MPPNVRSRVQSMTSPQSVRNRDRSLFVSAHFWQVPRHVPAVGGKHSSPRRRCECPRQSSHQSWHDGWQMTSQLPPQSAQRQAWRPAMSAESARSTASVRRNGRAASSRCETCPAQCPQPRPVHDQSAVDSVALSPNHPLPASGVASDAASAQLPGNVRDVSGQLAGSVPQDADESARQSLHHSWHDGSQMTWQFPPQSTPQITKQTGWRPRSSPRGVRQYPINHPEIFHVLFTTTI